MLVSVFGCGNEHLKEKIKDLEDEKHNAQLQLQEQSTRLEATSDVIKAVNSLIKSINETELKIDDNKQKLRNTESVTESVENGVDAKEVILSDIQDLYDELKMHRQRADELQKKLDSFVDNSDSNTDESLSALKTIIKEKTLKIDNLERQIGSLKKQIAHLDKLQSELSNQVHSYSNSSKEKSSKISFLKKELLLKDKALSGKELEIDKLQEEINTVYCLIGESDDLIKSGIIVKRGIPIINTINPFSKSYSLGRNCTSSKFKHEKKTKTIYRMNGKIEAILPYRDKEYYDIYYEDGISVINIKDSTNFWYVKFLVIATH